MTDFKYVKTDRKGNIGIVTFNRPEAGRFGYITGPAG